MSDLRELLEKAQGEAQGYITRRQASEILYNAITTALAQLEEMERDHEAMDVLRGDYGWKLNDGGELIVYAPGYKGGKTRCEDDPADAILGASGEDV